MSSALDSKDYSTWDPAQVCQYVLSVLPPANELLQRSGAKFVEHNVDGPLLPFLTSQHLKEMGIEPLRTRLLLKRAFATLSTGEGSESSSNSSSSDQLAFPLATHSSGIDVFTHVCIEALSLSTSLITEIVTQTSSLSPTDTIRLRHRVQDIQSRVKPVIIQQGLYSDVRSPVNSNHNNGGGGGDSAFLEGLNGSLIQEYALSPPPDGSTITPRHSEGNVGPPDSVSLNYSSFSPPMLRNGSFESLIPSPGTLLTRFSQATLISTGVGEVAHLHLGNQPEAKHFHRYKPWSTEGSSPDNANNNSMSNSRHGVESREAGGFPFFDKTTTTTTTSNTTPSISPGHETFVLQSRRPILRVKSLGKNSRPSNLQPSSGTNKASDSSAEIGRSFLLNRALSSPYFQSNKSPMELSSAQQQLYAGLTSASNVARNGLLSTHSGGDISRPHHSTRHPLNALSSSSASTITHNTSSSISGNNEPLKQLRASTDDSCLKVLQSAMKRHHIARDDWSKYVLVICYGDKERILKLAEKPVVVFKELQELGKRPAIMLRQLAEDGADEEDGHPFLDSRLSDEIPGGVL